MAFAKGKVSDGGFKVFTGVGKVKCLGVNLSAEQLSAIYGREVTSVREFISEAEIEGVKYPRVSLRFTVQKEDDGDGISFITTAEYPLVRKERWNADHTKMQIIDVYGRTAWATPEEVKAKAIPQYSNGPANIDRDYRVAYTGEEYLVLFLQSLLNIPNVTKFVDGKPAGLIDNPEDAESRLSHIEDYFKGDFSEIREILSYQPENKVQLCFGVRKDDQNRNWQAVYTRMPLKANARSYTKLENDIKQAQDRGSFKDTTFSVEPLAEYVDAPSVVAPTQQEAPQSTSPWFKA